MEDQLGLGAVITLALGAVELAKAAIGKLSNGNGSRSELERERFDRIGHEIREGFRNVVAELATQRKMIADGFSNADRARNEAVQDLQRELKKAAAGGER